MISANIAAVLLMASDATACPSDIETAMDLEQISHMSGASRDMVAEQARALSSLSLDADQPENSWELWIWYRDTTEGETTDCLFTLVAQEQFARLWFRSIQRPDEPVETSPEERAMMGYLTSALDSRNREWLRAVVADQGWFTISEFGEGADRAAFLIVQHADRDVAFQREMLDLLSGLVDTGETRPSGYALLTDRVAVNSGEPQLYGSQGGCTGLRQWEARPYSGTFEDMDARRESVGLEHHAAYVSRMAENCSSDQRH